MGPGDAAAESTSAHAASLPPTLNDGQRRLVAQAVEVSSRAPLVIWGPPGAQRPSHRPAQVGAERRRGVGRNASARARAQHVCVKQARQTWLHSEDVFVGSHLDDLAVCDNILVRGPSLRRGP